MLKFSKTLYFETEDSHSNNHISYMVIICNHLGVNLRYKDVIEVLQNCAAGQPGIGWRPEIQLLGL